MSLRIVESAVAAEQADALHEARLLLLLRQQTDKGDGTVKRWTSWCVIRSTSSVC